MSQITISPPSTHPPLTQKPAQHSAPPLPPTQPSYIQYLKSTLVEKLSYGKSSGAKKDQQLLSGGDDGKTDILQNGSVAERNDPLAIDSPQLLTQKGATAKVRITSHSSTTCTRCQRDDLESTDGMCTSCSITETQEECITTTETELVEDSKQQQSYGTPVKVEELKAGDHIYVCRTLYQHHGIYVGRTENHEHSVIHFCPHDATIDEKSSENCVIQETSLERFVWDSTCIYRKEYGVSYLSYLWKRKGTTNYLLPECGERIVERARSRLGERNYSLAFNNCESVCHWCVTGNSVASDQVRGVVAATATTAGVVAGAALAGIGLASYALYRVVSSSGGTAAVATEKKSNDKKDKIEE